MADAAPDQIATAAEFTRELQALRTQSGLTIRAIARAAKRRWPPRETTSPAAICHSTVTSLLAS